MASSSPYAEQWAPALPSARHRMQGRFGGCAPGGVGASRCGDTLRQAIRHASRSGCQISHRLDETGQGQLAGCHHRLGCCATGSGCNGGASDRCQSGVVSCPPVALRGAERGIFLSSRLPKDGLRLDSVADEGRHLQPARPPAPGPASFALTYSSFIRPNHAGDGASNAVMSWPVHGAASYLVTVNRV